MSFDLSYIQKSREAIVETAQSMLDGRTGYIEGSRQICGLLDAARLERLEPPFVMFVAIDSETDHVPVGKVRDRWHPDAKMKFAQEWADAEQYAKSHGEVACRQTILGLAEHPFDFPASS